MLALGIPCVPDGKEASRACRASRLRDSVPTSYGVGGSLLYPIRPDRMPVGCLSPLVMFSKNGLEDLP